MAKQMGSEFLFAMPSVLSGVARSLDLGATFDSYNERLTEELADAKALYADWRTVGEALAESIDRFAEREPDAAVLATGLVEK